jgi:hypothetical protein
MAIRFGVFPSRNIITEAAKGQIYAVRCMFRSFRHVEQQKLKIRAAKCQLNSVCCLFPSNSHVRAVNIITIRFVYNSPITFVRARKHHSDAAKGQIIYTVWYRFRSNTHVRAENIIAEAAKGQIFMVWCIFRSNTYV